MKNAICLLLTIAILFACESALADQDTLVSPDNQKYDSIKMLGRNCYVAGEGSDTMLYLCCEFMNVGTNVVSPKGNGIRINFLDSSGKTVYTSIEYAVFLPGDYFAPGSVFYMEVIERVKEHPDLLPVIQDIVDYKITLSLNEIDRYSTVKILPVLPTTYTIEKKSGGLLENLFYGHSRDYYEFTGTVTNNTGRDLDTYSYGFDVYVIFRDDDGAPIQIDTVEPDFNKLQAGETRQFKMRTYSTYTMTYLNKYNYTAVDVDMIFTVPSHCYN